MFVKDFAMKQGVSVQAIYKLLKTHKDVLEGHIQTDKRGKFLDEYAIDYLEGRMQGNPYQIVDTKLQKEIEDLKAENDRLRKDRDSMLDEPFLKKTKILELEEQQKLLPDLQSQLEDKTKEIGILEGFIKDAKENIEVLKKEHQVEMEAERTRKLSWKERFLGRKLSE